jgi:hypothetical protein
MTLLAGASDPGSRTTWSVTSVLTRAPTAGTPPTGHTRNPLPPARSMPNLPRKQNGPTPKTRMTRRRVPRRFVGRFGSSFDVGKALLSGLNDHCAQAWPQAELEGLRKAHGDDSEFRFVARVASRALMARDSRAPAFAITDAIPHRRSIYSAQKSGSMPERCI